jgi:hypothetical protein
MRFEWAKEDRFRSNYGSGPLVARILSATDKDLRMERWPQSGGRKTRFTLSLKFFLSPRCGWVKR